MHHWKCGTVSLVIIIFIEPLNSKYHPFIVEWRHLNHLLRQIDSPYFCSFRVSSKPHRLLFGKTKLIRERFRIINCDLWLLGTISSLSLPFFWLSRSHYLLQASYKLFYSKIKVGRRNVEMIDFNLNYFSYRSTLLDSRKNIYSFCQIFQT